MRNSFLHCQYYFTFYIIGFVQFVESTALADVIKTDGSILNFFQKHAPSENSPLGVAPEIMDNYIKSLGEYPSSSCAYGFKVKILQILS